MFPFLEIDTQSCRSGCGRTGANRISMVRTGQIGAAEICIGKIRLVYAARGKYFEAINNYKEMIRLNGAHTGVDCYLGFALARAGKSSEARTILNKLETGKEYVSPVELAVLYVGLDERDKVFSALERAYIAQDAQLQYLRVEPHFDSLRSDARFADLLQRVGFPQ